MPLYNNGQSVDKVKHGRARSLCLCVHCSKLIGDWWWMMLLCRRWLWATPEGLKKYSYAKLELRTRSSHVRRKWLLVTGLPGSIVLLIHQSATHQCGTNQSCACVVIVIRMFEPVSQGAEILMNTYIVICTICTYAKFQAQNIGKTWMPTTVCNHLTGMYKDYKKKMWYSLPMEAHLKTCCVLGTGKCSNCFPLLRHHFEHLQ